MNFIECGKEAIDHKKSLAVVSPIYNIYIR